MRGWTGTRWKHGKLTRWKVLRGSTNPPESVFVANTWQHLPHLLFCGPLVSIFPTELFCKQSPVFVNNRRFTEFWPLFPHPSTDRNETRTWSSLTHRNLRIKFGTNLSTIFFVIVVTDTHTPTERQANQRRWKHSLAFAGIIRNQTQPLTLLPAFILVHTVLLTSV